MWGYSTASWIEIGFTLYTLRGLRTMIRLERAARSDETYLRNAKINGIRQITTRMSLRTERTYVFILAVLTVAGIVFMTQPSRSGTNTPTVGGIVLGLAIIAIVAALTNDATKRRNERIEIHNLEAARLAAERWDRRTERRQNPLTGTVDTVGSVGSTDPGAQR